METVVTGWVKGLTAGSVSGLGTCWCSWGSNYQPFSSFVDCWKLKFVQSESWMLCQQLFININMYFAQFGFSWRQHDDSTAMFSYDDATWRTSCRPGVPVDVKLFPKARLYHAARHKPMKTSNRGRHLWALGSVNPVLMSWWVTE